MLLICAVDGGLCYAGGLAGVAAVDEAKRAGETQPAAAWYAMDNAGKIFASLNSWRMQSNYRLSVTLRQPIHYERLQGALQRTLPRFPLFRLRIKPGFFWYYFEPSEQPPQVLADSRFPLGEAFSAMGRSYPWRIRLHHCTLALDCAHALTDGFGALTFLNTLLAEYLGYDGPRAFEQGLLDLAESPRLEELENAFPKYYTPGLPAVSHPEPAAALSLTPEAKGIRHVTCGRVPVAALKAQSRAAKVSIGEYLNAVYLEALQGAVLEGARDPLKLDGPIRIDVPVNLRAVFASQSLRNFFITAFVEIDARLGAWDFEEILASVHYQMRLKRNPKFFRQVISRNVGSERNPFLRHLPLAVKNALMPWIFRKWNLRWSTSGLSNLGQIRLPDAMAAQVERYDFLPTHPASRKLSCGAIAFGEEVSVTFNRTAREPTVERLFFRALQAREVPVTIESNEQ